MGAAKLKKANGHTPIAREVPQAEHLTPEAIAGEARRLWTLLDGKLDRQVQQNSRPHATMLASLLVLHRLREKARATLMDFGMTAAQLDEFDKTNGLVEKKNLIQRVMG